MSHSKKLLVASAIFGVIGVMMGAHMAGAGSYALRPVHAHVLVVGWLSLFSWSIYYKVYKPERSLLTTLHVWTALIGSAGLNAGMYVFMLDTIPLPDVFSLIFYIVSGTVLALSFILFLVLAVKEPDTE
ncbi:hypothetical protein SAMN05518684_11990 [Salipaludibacillus aurantiacus]|uniref:Cytochrome C and Quinol oxidase polypeptide I n=1 Tax=Salipaludibacillus aurantiacus TaxID=1601833 RepID=A0A1H9WSI3_9BACI|nr:hypothetical protein [Salipaludibacillus aurantiacus]SES36892.1 hypothetical protein SAMN05518684_11990 [Salipaludibacillus aurantiacus]